MGGMSQIFAGVDYMRTMEGQKRLVYFGPGMAVPSTDDDHSIAAMANDARVALDMIQTGGIEGFSMWRGTLGASPGFGESFNFASMRSLSRQTGGQASITEFTRTALDRVDVATRTQYPLGYYPKNTSWNGKYRRIEVRVDRPDLDVVWRQGYYARQAATPYDAEGIPHGHANRDGCAVPGCRDGHQAESGPARQRRDRSPSTSPGLP